MVALNRRAVAEEPLQPAARLEVDVVVAEHARSVLVLVVPDHLREMLHEVAPAGDVQDLAAPADGEHRHVPRERSLEQRELGAIPVRADAVGLRMRLGVVDGRVDIRAAGEEDAVERIERLLDPVFGGWHEKRAPACPLDGANVGEGRERGGSVPNAPVGVFDARRDADDGPELSPARRGAPARSR
jgi:hypothetical protein